MKTHQSIVETAKLTDFLYSFDFYNKKYTQKTDNLI